ncbi:MAG: hypothetical protein EBV34_14220 [Betaproteobacteria bacterium]|nr:hypothetical protein [Betaproteobacteria bacterium]
MGLLCQLLEQDSPEIAASTLLNPDAYAKGGEALLHERLLSAGMARRYVTCPECLVEAARVVKHIDDSSALLFCDDCGELQSPLTVLRTYTVNVARVVERLATGLVLPLASRKAIGPNLSWRLGIQERRRGVATTWYFGRRLSHAAHAKALVDQIKQDKSARSAKILTSSTLPLCAASPLAGYELLELQSVARLSQSRFHFFDNRLDSSVDKHEEETPLGNSLDYVRSRCCAYVNGVKYPLENMQQKILLALMDAHAHRLEGGQIATRCGSSAFPFQPIKYFGRNALVYKTFVRYIPGDKVYELISEL